MRSGPPPEHGITSAVETTGSKSHPAPGPARWRVLVVDDEPAIGRCIRALLDGHDVDIVTSGAAAIARLHEDGAYDAVLCDLMMPSVSGIDVHADIAKTRPGLERRFVFMTGGAFTERAARFLAAIPNVRLDKPFGPQSLEEAIGAVVAATRG